MNAVDPEMVMPRGMLNVYEVIVIAAHDVRDAPDMVH